MLLAGLPPLSKSCEFTFMNSLLADIFIPDVGMIADVVS